MRLQSAISRPVNIRTSSVNEGTREGRCNDTRQTPSTNCRKKSTSLGHDESRRSLHLDRTHKPHYEMHTLHHSRHQQIQSTARQHKVRDHEDVWSTCCCPRPASSLRSRWDRHCSPPISPLMCRLQHAEMLGCDACFVRLCAPQSRILRAVELHR